MKKKIFTFMIILIFIISLSFVSASENDTVLSASNDDVMGISNDNISLQSDANDGILGQSLEHDNLLGDAPSKITVDGIHEGIIEDNKITLTVTLTDMEDKPLEDMYVDVYIDNNRITNVLTDIYGKFTYDVEMTTGFHYGQFIFTGQKDYAPSQSGMFELAFANTNDLTDLVVRQVMSNGTFDLTKDYIGYGSNSVVRRNLSNYNQIIYDSGELNKGIPISGNVVINGNGHTIDVSSTYDIRSFFRIDNAALTLNNISLLNGYSTFADNPIFPCKGNVNINFNDVVLANYYTPTMPGISTAAIDKFNTWTTADIKVNMVNSILINNRGLLMNKDMKYSSFDSCTFINNGILFEVGDWYGDYFRNNIFLNNEKVFHCMSNSIWEGGYITGNYWGTNDSSVINSMCPTGDDVYVPFGSHTYLTVDGNPTFSEDDIQDYKIYFSGTYANRVPAYKTVLTYTSAYSTINVTDINISSNPTTVRVSPKTYGLETLVIEPDLYELNINITKSTKINYNVTVDAPESEYSVPLVITVNVNDADGNPVTTTANITVGGTTTPINITDGIGTLSVNSLAPGNYDITTKVISNMANYRNTTIYSSTYITKGSMILTLSCNNTTSIAREILPLVIKTQNSIGNNRSATVNIMEDDVVVGTVTTDADGNGIFNYRPEAGSHVYKVTIISDKYWKSSESNMVDVYVMEKIPTKLTISSDTEMITKIGQKAKITVRLSDVDNIPVKGAGIKLLVNDAVVDFANTDNNGECEFEYTNTSGLYSIKAVYDGNLTYYDNSSEIIELIVSTGGNFFDLSVLINATKKGGVLTLIRDFTFNETLDQDFVNGIPINRDITIKGSDYTVNASNKARVFNIGKNTTVTIDGLNVVNAASTTSGGAIYFDGNTLTVSNSNFENNTVTLSGYDDSTIHLGGGAIYSNSVLNIVDSVFNDNKVLIHNDAYIKYSGGGAIFTNNNININNSVFDSNNAVLVEIVEKSIAEGVGGSAVYIYGGDASIYNSTFKNGLTNYGAVYYDNSLSGKFMVYDSVFSNNSGSAAGAITFQTHEGKIINTTFENNSGNSTGAINIQADNFLVSESKFFNNSAEQLGSAIYVIPSRNVTVEKSYFINNHDADGGTISYGDNVQLTLRYNIFVNNTANASGVYYDYFDEYMDDRGNLNYDYWGNNTPYDANIFNEYIRKGYEYITLEIIGPNVTYTTIPTTYIIRFNGTDADKLPNLDTLIRALSDAGVDLDKSSITVNGSGAKVVLTSDAVQNITLVVGPEYNILNSFDIVVEKLIKKNYTSNITVTNNVYGKTAIVTVDILDENGDVADVNGFLTYTFNDKNQNATIKNGKAQIPLSNLDVGNYYINFTYIATYLFYNDLGGNKSFDVSKANVTFTLDVNNATYGEDVNIKATPQRGVEGNFTFYIRDVLNKTVEIEYGKASYVLKNLAAGNYTIVATFNGGKNYNSSTLSRNFKVSKALSKIEITIDDVNYCDEIIAFVTGEGVTGSVTVTVNNKNYTVEIVNNAGNVTIDKLDVGKYNATVIYKGNANVTGLTNKTTFNVYKGSSNMAVDIGESIFGQNTPITVTFNDDVEGNVKVTVDGKDYVLPIKNGVASLDLTDLAVGNHTVNVVYPGNKNYNSSSFNTTFSTKSTASQINVTASGAVYGGNVIVTAKVTSGATGNVEFTINNITKTATVKDGVARVTFEGLNAGKYDVTAKYLGDSTYISSTNTTTVTVSKASSTVLIDIGEIKENENIVITFTVLGNATGNITVEIPGLYSPRNRTLENGVNKWTIFPAYGKYTVKVTYNGDNNYLTSSNSTTFSSKLKPALDIEISDAFVGDDYTIDVILNSTATGTVLITVDGAEYNKTLKNGKASVTLKNLTAGNHTVDVIYSGDAKFYNATGSKTFEPKSAVSSINVTAADIVHGNDLVVKATVTAGATGNVVFTVNGVTKTAAVKNGAAEASFSDLNAGTYKVTAKYLGDRQYTSATNTTTVNVKKAGSFVLIDVGEIKEGENVIIRFSLPSDASGNVTVEIPGLYTARNRTVTNGAASWTISPLKPGTYTLNVVYNGDKNYLASSNSTVLISKYYPDIIIGVGETIVGQDAAVNVALPKNATGSVLISVDGVKYNKTLKDGKASVVISNIAKGTHTVDVLYSGDMYYYSSGNSTSFEPKSQNSTISVIASDIVYGENLVVRAVVNEDATGTVTFTVNGVNKTVAVHQGFASATFGDVNAGNYVVKAVYSGNDVYLSSSNTTNVRVNKANSTILIKVGEIREGQNVVITFIASNNATGNITVEIPGLYSPRVRTLSNNENRWTISPLSAGLYEVRVSYGGDSNYYGTSNSTHIDYNRVKTALDVGVEVSKTKVRLNANLTAEDGQLITAWVNITIGDNRYRIPVYNGTGHLDIPRLNPGNYTFEAFYAGTRVIVNSSDSGSFEVDKIFAVLSVPDVVKYYGGTERLYVYLKDSYNDPIANGTVVITINGIKYTRTTDAKGTASIALGLNSGLYDAAVVFSDAQYGSVNATSKVNIMPTVNGTDLVKVFRNATQYYATFRDSQGNYLPEGTTVNFNINGVFYERKISGDKGLARLNINLEQGSYILTAMNPVTGENTANNITVIPRIVENRDLTKYYRNDSQYTVKVIGDDGKAVGAGVTVTFNINGVFYQRQTNASGIAKLSINLNPDDYIITAEYGGCMVSNKIKVLPILSAKDMVKKYGTSDQFVATLVDGQGKPYSGQNVQFNINGVFYTRTTNSYGQARLNINLQPGQYIITSSYNTASIANKVTVTP